MELNLGIIPSFGPKNDGDSPIQNADNNLIKSIRDSNMRNSLETIKETDREYAFNTVIGNSPFTIPK